MPLVAFEAGRNVISILKNKNDYLFILHQLQAKYVTK